MAGPERSPNLDARDARDDGTRVNTGGGTYVEGNVDTGGGDFIGRDKHVHISDDQSYDVSGLPNPYLGLRAFTYDDRAAYAGREREVAAAVEKLTSPGAEVTLLFITGASGSGKSSFAQAGLLPALEAYYAKRNMPVSSAVFRPSQRPMAMLKDALMQMDVRDLPGFKNLSAPGVSILIIDQFEELFTQSDLVERSELFKWLTELPPFEQCRAHVVATLRSDYLNE